MCGIIGIISAKPVAATILEGLKRLEYRGYDSAGIATVGKGEWARVRAEGKLVNLGQALQKSPLHGTTGIGHTRWATHGAPNKENAHPHMTDQVAVVHNGIIENFRELRTELEAKGIAFESQTDTEVVPQLITWYRQQGHKPIDAIAATLKRLEGTFALGIILHDQPDILIAARRGSPLAIGHGDGEMYLGSDAIALAPLTSRLTYLEDGDWAVLTTHDVTIYNAQGEQVTRPERTTSISGEAVGKGEYPHYMLKEIYEQPAVTAETLSVFASVDDGSIHLPEMPFELSAIKRITLIACGTSYYAALVARYWLERYGRLIVEVEVASEYRYRDAFVSEGDLAIVVSQSGETADTLAAMRQVKEKGGRTLAIVNVPESTMAHEADAVLHTYAGPEIGVASTKAFTTQLITLACFTLALAQARGSVSGEEYQTLLHVLRDTPSRISEVLSLDNEIAKAAKTLVAARDVLYIGRGTSYALAMEGALKLKEISYIHAEGYAAGELKHGPIALIDNKVPVIVIAPSDSLFVKTLSNVQEAAARGGNILLFTDAEGKKLAHDIAPQTVLLPKLHPLIAPIIYAVPIQLLAYHVAVQKGTDVDQPRNLAKSVTVE